MPLTATQILHFKALVGAWYHQTRRPLPKGYSPHAPTVGVVFRRMIVVYQKAHGLKVTGELDTATQKSLTPVDPRASKAAHTMAYCTWGIDHADSFTYAQDRPIHAPSPPDLWSLPRRRDCSAFAKDAARAGGFSPLDGDGDQYGNTDSMLAYARAHNRIRSIAQLRQADMVIFSNPGHIVVVTGTHDTDPQGILLLTGDGHQGAPNVTTLQQQIDTHHGSYYGIAVD